MGNKEERPTPAKLTVIQSAPAPPEPEKKKAIAIDLGVRMHDEVSGRSVIVFYCNANPIHSGASFALDSELSKGGRVWCDRCSRRHELVPLIDAFADGEIEAEKDFVLAHEDLIAARTRLLEQRRGS